MTLPSHRTRTPVRPAVSAFPRVAAATSLVLLLALLAPTPGAAQRTPAREFSVDPEVLGGSLSYAWGGTDGTYWGVGGGLGGSLLSAMVLGGRHFSEEGWIAYEERDRFGDEFLLELIHAEVFRRWSPSPRQDYDLGVRASVFLHFDASDDDPGGGGFLGAYGTALWGWERLKIGPRVLVGYFTEGAGTRELGIFVSPLTGRISFGW